MLLGEHVLKLKEKAGKLNFKGLFARWVIVDETELSEDARVGLLHWGDCRLFGITHLAPLCQLFAYVGSIELPGRRELQWTFCWRITGDVFLWSRHIHDYISTSMLQLLVICGSSLIRNCDLTGTSLMICRYITTKCDIFDLTALISSRILRARRSRLQLPHWSVFGSYILLRGGRMLRGVVSYFWLIGTILGHSYEAIVLFLLYGIGAVYRLGERLFATTVHLWASWLEQGLWNVFWSVFLLFSSDLSRSKSACLKLAQHIRSTSI